jgi:hypothetical protein
MIDATENGRQTSKKQEGSRTPLVQLSQEQEIQRAEVARHTVFV